MKSNEEDKFECIPCNKIFSCKRTLMTHLSLSKVHVGSKFSQAEISKMKKANETIWDSRVSKIVEVTDKTSEPKHHPKGSVFCHMCDASFLKDDQLQLHISKVHFGEEGPKDFKCNLCPKAYETKRSLQYHLKNVHNVSKFEINCDVCGKFFTEKEKLDIHVEKNHKFMRFMNFKCKNVGCGEAFKNRRSLIGMN